MLLLWWFAIIISLVWPPLLISADASCYAIVCTCVWLYYARVCPVTRPSRLERCRPTSMSTEVSFDSLSWLQLGKLFHQWAYAVTYRCRAMKAEQRASGTWNHLLCVHFNYYWLNITFYWIEVCIPIPICL